MAKVITGTISVPQPPQKALTPSSSPIVIALIAYAVAAIIVYFVVPLDIRNKIKCARLVIGNLKIRDHQGVT